MLSIGEFSNICKVSTKTLRYYAEIGLLLPDEIIPENGYRYYSIEQLETMLFINRLKSYNFSLEEIKNILEAEELQDEKLYLELTRKKKEIEKQVQEFEKTLDQLNTDLTNLKQGKSIMSYMESIDTQLVEVPMMYLLSIRKMVHEHEVAEEYGNCFRKLFRKTQVDKLTVLAPPMVLFHSEEFSPFGLDIEFAIPVKEYVTGTRDFYPGLCLKTVLNGSYSNLSSVYTKQREWAEKEGYESSNALYEVYVTDPSGVSQESDLITEIYYPVKKKSTNI
ncbi:DNA-binding transcriptional regulator, MerR family [Anaerosporobacter mobilis DSM 15930]|jgi:DNA-binding transcriptional MerR regulator/effector-binding domain-containing protein|uniref:DNA-binding transcriptional regulator, MerR family n=1 Tax=Anaerosporobacter mobilis DSM 15930 TaxID=1120996 RepID=A0A1M7MID2_9FIRM|nr:MerR family transcriptional regulator [Anaerosporobacter mobilis]SHM90219.1 DNA-binding transcriptional regulator, MerR family [Anaerosporobacter mobilis DSM 15930]